VDNSGEGFGKAVHVLLIARFSLRKARCEVALGLFLRLSFREKRRWRGYTPKSTLDGGTSGVKVSELSDIKEYALTDLIFSTRGTHLLIYIL
jgi:hypothetical protein